MNNPRVFAANVIYQVAHEGRSLDDSLSQALPSCDPGQHGFLRALCFGVLRFYPRLLFFLSQLLDKPVRNKEKRVECLLLAGLYEVLYMHTAEHAAVSQNVEASNALKKTWARGLINAVLRNAIRQRETLEATLAENDAARYAHPKWLLRTIRQGWPDDSEKILHANNQPGPFSLRVNQQHLTTQACMERLTQHAISTIAGQHAPSALICEQAVEVSQLPGFSEGDLSVQDQAAQLAAGLLQPQPGERILDACAAPGGKTAHLLETCRDIRLLALDKSMQRLEKVSDNLQRAGLNAEVVQGDACQPAKWWDGEKFDRILLDAPCSATGVIRRHPDIKLLRRPDDIARLVATQAQMLSALWPLLKSGGMLLYSTCSILAEENVKQIQTFVQKNNNARSLPIEAQWGRPMEFGRQILPGEDNMDGFFYATIYKSPD